MLGWEADEDGSAPPEGTIAPCVAPGVAGGAVIALGMLWNDEMMVTVTMGVGTYAGALLTSGSLPTFSRSRRSSSGMSHLDSFVSV